MSTDENYVPYSEPWKKEMLKFSKSHLVDILGEVYKQRKDDKELIKNLAQCLRCIMDHAYAAPDEEDAYDFYRGLAAGFIEDAKKVYNE